MKEVYLRGILQEQGHAMEEVYHPVLHATKANRHVVITPRSHLCSRDNKLMLLPALCTVQPLHVVS